MKRRGDLNRSTPLKQGKPLSRDGRGTLHAGPWPSRSKPIKARRDKSRRRRREVAQLDHGMDWSDVRLVIYARSWGRCEACGAAVNVNVMQAHHRRTRRIGPDCPCNALALCPTCHHDETHGKPAEATALGRIVSKLADVEPGQVPVTLHDGREVLLTCAGAYEVAA